MNLSGNLFHHCEFIRARVVANAEKKEIEVSNIQWNDHTRVV